MFPRRQQCWSFFQLSTEMKNAKFCSCGQRTGEPNRLHYISYLLYLNVMVVIVIIDGVFSFCTFLYFCFPVLLRSNRVFILNIFGHSESVAEMKATRLSSSLHSYLNLTRLLLFRFFIFSIPKCIWICHVFAISIPNRSGTYII